MKTVILLIFLLLGCNSKEGPKGDRGLTGRTGAQGPKGDTGPQGIQGPAGENNGVIGPQGPIGPTGADGPQGNKGNAGPQGPIGLTGPAGAAGNDGATGPQGDKGDTGATGPQGIQGEAGKDGEDGLASIYKEELDPDPTITCAGVLVDVTYGNDDDRNGQMEPEEIKGSFLWCKKKADVELVTRSEKAPIGKCIKGGNMIFFAEDTNKDGFVSDGDVFVNLIKICKE